HRNADGHGPPAAANHHFDFLVDRRDSLFALAVPVVGGLRSARVCRRKLFRIGGLFASAQTYADSTRAGLPPHAWQQQGERQRNKDVRTWLASPRPLRRAQWRRDSTEPAANAPAIAMGISAGHHRLARLLRKLRVFGVA